VQTTIIGPRKTRPVFDVKAEFPAASARGKATLKLVRFIRCRRWGYVFRKVASYGGTFDARGHAKFCVKRPRKTLGYYAATVSFGGTHFVRARRRAPRPVASGSRPRGRALELLPHGRGLRPGLPSSLPIEETLSGLGPALLVALGVVWASLRASLRRLRSRDRVAIPGGAGHSAGLRVER
jgi:hypothetical protein